MPKPVLNIIRNALAAGGNDRLVYVLVTNYHESDPAETAGQIFRTEGQRGGRVQLALGVQDPLSRMWVSPSGSVWAGTSNGALWTTAPGVQAPADPEIEIETDAPDLNWRRIPIAPLEGQSVAPTISALSGIDDQQVFAGTYDGKILRFDGAAFSVIPSLGAGTVNEIYPAPDGSLLVASNGSLARIVGSGPVSWTLPEPLDRYTVVTGVRATRHGDVFACTRNGHFLVGNANEIRVAEQHDVQFYGVAVLEDRVIAVSSPGGAWEWDGSKLVALKPNFSAVDCYEVGTRLFCVESEQLPDPCLVEYDPIGLPPWGRRSFPLED